MKTRNRTYFYLLIFLVIPLIPLITLNSKPLTILPTREEPNSSSYQNLEYEFTWDEFADAPGDILGDDILHFGPSFGLFHNYTEIVSKLHNLEQNFPNYCEVFSIGKTHLEHDIYGIKLTDELVTTSKEEILIVAQHHAREQITVENALYYVDKLIYEARNNQEVALTALATREIYIIPSLNIDGTLLINVNPWQRKTVNGMDLPEGEFAFSDLEVNDLNENGYIEVYYQKSDEDDWKISGYEGVDLNNDSVVGDALLKGTDPNRNYDYDFGNPVFSSNIQESFVYSGSSAFSEECTRHLKDFIALHKFKTSISLHSGIQAIYYPYITKDNAKEDFDVKNYDEATKVLRATLGFETGAIKNNAGLFTPWNYWTHTENRLTYCLETYGNRSAIQSEYDASTGIYAEYGIWDFFNPAANQVIANSELIYAGLDFLVNFINPEPKTAPSPLLIGIGVTGCVSIAFFIMRYKKRKIEEIKKNPSV